MMTWFLLDPHQKVSNSFDSAVNQGSNYIIISSCCGAGVWDKVLEPVAERRNEAGSLKLFPVYLKGEDLFGLTVSAVTRIVESVSESQILLLRAYQVKNALMLHLTDVFVGMDRG